MNREVHVRFCEGLGCNSLGLLTYSRLGLKTPTLKHANSTGDRQAG